MTPERLREWIPARLHAALDAAAAVEQAVLAAPPAPPWPTHILAAIEEREIAPWLGASFFLRAGPEAAIRRYGLYDSDADWHRDAALLADLTLRFGDRLIEPLRALPEASLPLLARQWLDDEPNGEGGPTRLSEAERCLHQGNHAGALEHLLAEWRANADPLLADLIDVIDERLGPPMSRADADAFWAGPTSDPDPVTLGRALRRAYRTGSDARLLITGAGKWPPDPRVSTSLRRLRLITSLERSRAQDVVKALTAGGDLRSGPNGPLGPPSDLRARWSSALGPSARGRMRAMARTLGAELRPVNATVAEARSAAWSAGPTEIREVAAVYGDVLREQGDRLAGAFGVRRRDDLDCAPATAAFALLERPFGAHALEFRDGLVVRAWVGDRDLAMLDPAWGPVERLTLGEDLGAETGGWVSLPTQLALFLSRLKNLKGVLFNGVPVPDSHLLIEPGVWRQILAVLPPTVTEVGDPYGWFAGAMERGTAIVTREGSEVPEWFAHTRAPEVALVGAPRQLSLLADAAPPTLRRLVLVEEGTPLWDPRGWSLDLRLPSRRLVASYHPLGDATSRPPVRRTLIEFLALAPTDCLNDVRVVFHGGDPEENAIHLARLESVCRRFGAVPADPEPWRDDERPASLSGLGLSGPPVTGDEWEDLLERLNPDALGRRHGAEEELRRVIASILPEPWCEPLMPALEVFARRVAADRARLYRYRASRHGGEESGPDATPQGEELQNRVAAIQAVWAALQTGELRCGELGPAVAGLAWARVSTVWVADADRIYRAEYSVGLVEAFIFGPGLKAGTDGEETAGWMLAFAERYDGGGMPPGDVTVLTALIEQARRRHIGT